MKESCQITSQMSGHVFQRTERKLLVDTRPDDIRVNDQTVGDVIQCQKDRVSQQKLQAVVSTTVATRLERRLTISGISIRRMAPMVISTETTFRRRPSRKSQIRARVMVAAGKSLTVVKTAIKCQHRPQ